MPPPEDIEIGSIELDFGDADKSTEKAQDLTEELKNADSAGKALGMSVKRFNQLLRDAPVERVQRVVKLLTDLGNKYNRLEKARAEYNTSLPRLSSGTASTKGSLGEFNDRLDKFNRADAALDRSARHARRGLADALSPSTHVEGRRRHYAPTMPQDVPRLLGPEFALTPSIDASRGPLGVTASGKRAFVPPYVHQALDNLAKAQALFLKTITRLTQTGVSPQVTAGMGRYAQSAEALGEAQLGLSRMLRAGRYGASQKLLSQYTPSTEDAISPLVSVVTQQPTPKMLPEWTRSTKAGVSALMSARHISGQKLLPRPATGPARLMPQYSPSSVRERKALIAALRVRDQKLLPAGSPPKRLIGASRQTSQYSPSTVGRLPVMGQKLLPSMRTTFADEQSWAHAVPDWTPSMRMASRFGAGVTPQMAKSLRDIPQFQARTKAANQLKNLFSGSASGETYDLAPGVDDKYRFTGNVYGPRRGGPSPRLLLPQHAASLKTSSKLEAAVEMFRDSALGTFVDMAWEMATKTAKQIEEVRKKRWGKIQAIPSKMPWAGYQLGKLGDPKARGVDFKTISEKAKEYGGPPELTFAHLTKDWIKRAPSLSDEDRFLLRKLRTMDRGQYATMTEAAELEATRRDMAGEELEKLKMARAWEKTRGLRVPFKDVGGKMMSLLGGGAGGGGGGGGGFFGSMFGDFRERMGDSWIGKAGRGMSKLLKPLPTIGDVLFKTLKGTFTKTFGIATTGVKKLITGFAKLPAIASKVGGSLLKGLMAPFRMLTRIRHFFWNLTFLAGMIGGGIYSAVKALGPAGTRETWRKQFALLQGDKGAETAQERLSTGEGPARATLGWLTRYSEGIRYTIEQTVEAGRQMITFGLFSKRNFKLAADAAATYGRELTDVVKALGMITMGAPGRAMRRLRLLRISHEKLRERGVEITPAGRMIDDPKKMLAAVFSIWKDEVGGMGHVLADTFETAIVTLGDTVRNTMAKTFEGALPFATNIIQNAQDALREVRRRNRSLDWSAVGITGETVARNAMGSLLKGNYRQRIGRFLGEAQGITDEKQMEEITGSWEGLLKKGIGGLVAKIASAGVESAFNFLEDLPNVMKSTWDTLASIFSTARENWGSMLGGFTNRFMRLLNLAIDSALLNLADTKVFGRKPFENLEKHVRRRRAEKAMALNDSLDEQTVDKMGLSLPPMTRRNRDSSTWRVEQEPEAPPVPTRKPELQRPAAQRVSLPQPPATQRPAAQRVSWPPTPPARRPEPKPEVSTRLRESFARAQAAREKEKFRDRVKEAYLSGNVYSSDLSLAGREALSVFDKKRYAYIKEADRSNAGQEPRDQTKFPWKTNLPKKRTRTVTPPTPQQEEKLLTEASNEVFERRLRPRLMKDILDSDDPSKYPVYHRRITEARKELSAKVRTPGMKDAFYEQVRKAYLSDGYRRFLWDDEAGAGFSPEVKDALKLFREKRQADKESLWGSGFGQWVGDFTWGEKAGLNFLPTTSKLDELLREASDTVYSEQLAPSPRRVHALAQTTKMRKDFYNTLRKAHSTGDESQLSDYGKAAMERYQQKRAKFMAGEFGWLDPQIEFGWAEWLFGEGEGINLYGMTDRDKMLKAAAYETFDEKMRKRFFGGYMSGRQNTPGYFEFQTRMKKEAIEQYVESDEPTVGPLFDVGPKIKDTGPKAKKAEVPGAEETKGPGGILTPLIGFWKNIHDAGKKRLKGLTAGKRFTAFKHMMDVNPTVARDIEERTLGFYKGGGISAEDALVVAQNEYRQERDDEITRFRKAYFGGKLSKRAAGHYAWAFRKQRMFNPNTEFEAIRAVQAEHRTPGFNRERVLRRIGRTTGVVSNQFNELPWGTTETYQGEGPLPQVTEPIPPTTTTAKSYEERYNLTPVQRLRWSDYKAKAGFYRSESQRLKERDEKERKQFQQDQWLERHIEDWRLRKKGVRPGRWGRLAEGVGMMAMPFPTFGPPETATFGGAHTVGMAAPFGAETPRGRQWESDISGAVGISFERKQLAKEARAMMPSGDPEMETMSSIEDNTRRAVEVSEETNKRLARTEAENERRHSMTKQMLSKVVTLLA